MLQSGNNKKYYLNKSKYNFVDRMQLNAYVTKFELLGYNVKIVSSDVKHLLILTKKIEEV